MKALSLLVTDTLCLKARDTVIRNSCAHEGQALYWALGVCKGVDIAVLLVVPSIGNKWHCPVAPF